ncbi:uncharacterized protein LOC123257318 [Drosophila ananassae]|uniref:uncharacterized protein LOC123257318 n=1 Tax=Drosophila ananassae TaxID=7217 RepID=UPI001CFFEB99|nr:uncharacterized protein LOC123257318 [Drosophila ananassae]
MAQSGLSDERLDQLLRQFWEVETCTDPIVKASKEELDCESYFVKNCVRLEGGAYTVRLPIKHNSNLLGDSYSQALRRFQSLERKLSHQPELRTQYSVICPWFRRSCIKIANIFCHITVCKKDSTTTKLGVAFDGSAVTTSGYSLNDILMAGPVIQPKLFHILLRFRSHPVALTGDICKMYRCVRMASSDSFLQCILWRDSFLKELQTYKLDTVTYGTKPASYTSVRAMHQLAKDEVKDFPVGSEILLRDFYVDHPISGGSYKDEVVGILGQISALLSKGEFQLRKWCSNVPSVLDGVPKEDRESYLTFDDGSNFTKTLGLAWDPSTDQWLLSFSSLQPTSKPSRRSVLSSIARLYDLLGLVGPGVTKAKIFLQKQASFLG